MAEPYAACQQPLERDVELGPVITLIPIGIDLRKRDPELIRDIPVAAK